LKAKAIYDTSPHSEQHTRPVKTRGVESPRGSAPINHDATKLSLTPFRQRYAYLNGYFGGSRNA